MFISYLSLHLGHVLSLEKYTNLSIMGAEDLVAATGTGGTLQTLDSSGLLLNLLMALSCCNHSFLDSNCVANSRSCCASPSILIQG